MRVILYHQDGCGMCKAIEMQLKRKGIEFESCKDVELMIQKGITGTPTLEVDGERYTKAECIKWINGR